MKNWKILATFSLAGALSFACSSDDESGTNGDGDGDGDAGSGGTVLSTGGAPGTGGIPGTGGLVGVGGNIVNTGGALTTGGTAMGGAAFGGMGGDGTTVPTVGCDGCAILHVPFSTATTGTDVEVDLTEAGLADMSSTVVTVRVRVVMEGNAGGFQVFVKNGEPDYQSHYSAWTNFADATTDFVEVSLDLGAIADPEGTFSKSSVRYIGINAAAGEAWDGAVFDDVYLFIDSITFSDGSVADLTFDSSADGIAINIYNSPIDGSAVYFE